MQLEHGTLCKEIWSFINAFPIEDGWEKFMKVITSRDNIYPCTAAVNEKYILCISLYTCIIQF